VELYLHSPNTPSWRGAQLKHRDTFTFTFICTIGYDEVHWDSAQVNLMRFLTSWEHQSHFSISLLN